MSKIKHFLVVPVVLFLNACSWEWDDVVIDYTDVVFSHGLIEKGAIYRLDVDILTNGKAVYDSVVLYKHGFSTHVISVQDYVNNPDLLPGYFVIPKGSLFKLRSVELHRNMENSHLEFEIEICSGEFLGKFFVDRSRTLFSYWFPNNHYSVCADRVSLANSKTEGMLLPP